MTTKPDRARELLATQRSGLEMARKVWIQEGSAYGRQQIRVIDKRLRRVRSDQADLERKPDFFAPLILGFQGENGAAPLIRLLIAEAEKQATELMLEAAE